MSWSCQALVYIIRWLRILAHPFEPIQHKTSKLAHDLHVEGHRVLRTNLGHFLRALVTILLWAPWNTTYLRGLLGTHLGQWD